MVLGFQECRFDERIGFGYLCFVLVEGISWDDGWLFSLHFKSIRFSLSLYRYQVIV